MLLTLSQIEMMTMNVHLNVQIQHYMHNMYVKKIKILSILSSTVIFLSFGFYPLSSEGKSTQRIYRHGAQRHFHLQAQDWRRAYLLLPGATFGSLREPSASCFLSISDKATQLDFPSEIWAATTWPSEEQCISQQ